VVAGAAPHARGGGFLGGPASVVSLEVRRLASLAAPLTGDYGPAARDISPGHASIHAHVNPIGGCVGRLPTMPPMGFSCTLKG